MNKRLEEIKDRYMEFEYDFNLRKEDIDWLIEQAERAFKNAQDLEDMDRQLASEQKRVEELGQEVNDWRNEVKKWQKFYKESEESHLETKELLYSATSENKRYREAIEVAIHNMAASDNLGVKFALKILEQALEGEGNA